MNTRPPAVTSGPPAPGVPKLVSKCRNFGGWNGISFSMLPSGTSQTIFFLTISTAVSAAHGGAEHGEPSGESSGSTVGMYGEPATSKVMAPSDSIACSFDSLASLRGVSVMIVGTRFDGTTLMWLSGSYAPPPQFGPPPTDADKDVPLPHAGLATVSQC